MMRAVLTNFGTTGDLQPLLALASELAGAGHEPVIAFAPPFRQRVEAVGFEFVPLGADLLEHQHAASRAMLGGADDAESLHRAMAPLVETLPTVFGDLEAACRDADVLICGPGLPAGRMVHEVVGLPFVTLQVSHFGGIGSPVLRAVSQRLINPFRQQLGLTALDDPLTVDANSDQLTLYAMSRHVLPPPSGWPPHYHMTGFFFLDEAEFEPGEELARFLDAGDPPVVISFGSMVHDDPQAVTDAVFGAVERLGVRALVQQGWSGIGDRDLPSGVARVGFVPHGWLFHRAAAVVHHGGAGTAAAVFRSGRPSVFIPLSSLHDQTYWGQLAHELGVASRPLPFERLDADRLAAALATVVGDPDTASRARRLGEKVRGELGVVRARQLIEELVERVGLARDLPDAVAPRAGRGDATARRERYRQRRRRRERPAVTAEEGGT